MHIQHLQSTLIINCSVYLCICSVHVLRSYINPLTTNDDYSRHRNLAACYQLVQSVLKIGSALVYRKGGTGGGGWVYHSG